MILQNADSYLPKGTVSLPEDLHFQQDRLSAKLACMGVQDHSLNYIRQKSAHKYRSSRYSKYVCVALVRQ